MINSKYIDSKSAFVTVWIIIADILGKSIANYGNYTIFSMFPLFG